MDTREQKKIVSQLMDNICRAEWGTYIDLLSLSGGDLCQLSDYASSLSTLAAEVAEYLGYRGGNGCGDHGHEKARIAAQKQRKKVRKALGYTYP